MTHTNTHSSNTCPKCGGAGTLDWTSQDGGVCYKCEGKGYIGEMPAGFVKCSTKEIREAAKELVKVGVYNLKQKDSTFRCYPTYEMDADTIKELVERGKVFRFKYSNYFLTVPDMSITFGGDSEYCYNLIVGGEFLEIKPIKK